MATRQEIQMALDLIKFTNVVNDVFDSVIPVARGQKQKAKSTVVGGTSELENMTVADIKSSLSTAMISIQNYTNLNLKFLADPKKIVAATNGLAAWGVDVNSIITDNQDISSKAIQVNSDVSQATNQNDLNTIASYIETNIPNLGLVRKYT